MKARVIILVVFMSISAITIAQPQPDAMRKMKAMREQRENVGMERAERPMNGLNLTDAQKETFKQGMMAMQQQMKPLKNELGEVMAHQRTLNSADKPDFKAIDKNLEKAGQIKTEMAKIQTKHHLEMRAQLTPEQQMKFSMFKSKMMQNNGKKGMKHSMPMNRQNGMNHDMPMNGQRGMK